MSAGDLLGYLDRWSVHPGDTISCRVSGTAGDPYQANLVRTIQGDTNPDGPGYRQEHIPLDLGGPFMAQQQTIETGSFAIVDHAEVLAVDNAVSIVATIWPTTPQRGRQTLFSRMNEDASTGIELFIDKSGALTAECRLDGTIVTVSTGCTLLSQCWYRVAVSHDAIRGQLHVIQEPVKLHPAISDRGYGVAITPVGTSPFDIRAPLLMAASPPNDSNDRYHYNGRIYNPYVLSRILVDSIPDRPTVGDHLVAAWDFSIEIPSQRIVDVSGNGLHGRLVNLPTRAVAGPDWDGSCHVWTHDATHYGAIHFHDDDLYDANWQESFRVDIPANLASGVYAVRLERGRDTFHMPFCVRAPRARRDSDVVFLLPTASYMAYGNNRIGLDVPETELVCGRLIELTDQDIFMQTHPELGLCFYDLHNDGSPVYYASRLRPMMDFQPGFIGKLGGAGSNVWQFNADTHITGWFDAIDTSFDVVTDEDLHNEGVDCLNDYRVLVTGSHPEYYSASMRDALDDFIERGGRMMYLGGNGFYWRVSPHPELPGVIECRKSEDGIRAAAPGPGEYYASFTGEYTGLWRRNGRPPNTLVGVGMVAQGFDRSSPYIRSEASNDPRLSFMFEGIETDIIGDYGLSGGGAAGIELDAANVELGTPHHALIVASSSGHSDLYLVTPEDMLDPVPGLGGSEAENISADIVFFETSAGGAVFSVGSIAWAGSMAWNNYDNAIAQLTYNVLNRFLNNTPFNITPSSSKTEILP
ncbi:MAG: large subunit of N,N-dimethylformamidase [marine bacterium B5-7]|nr:MAG: large subunit of N,N-dimethylformamidase [marine bacterium B5-7]